MAIDPAFAETHSECYVAPGRRWTTSANDSLVVYEGGALVLVHNSAVEQAVQDGVLLPPGQPYVAPAGFPMGMPLIPSSGITKRYGRTVDTAMQTVAVPAPSSPGKVITLPSAPTDAGSIYVEVNGRGYLGPAIVAMNGAAVTLSFTVLPSDTITATYR